MFRIVSARRYQEITTHPLTGLITRTAFDRRIARRYRYVWYFDLDGLKQINDKEGHEAGDRHIQAGIAELYQHFRRSTDYLIHWGGDELLAFSDRGELPPLKYWSAGRSNLATDLEAAIRVADAKMYNDKRLRKCRQQPPKTTLGAGVR